MTADGELDIKRQRLLRHRLQGEHQQTVLHTITTAGCSTRRLCREPLHAIDDCFRRYGYSYIVKIFRDLKHIEDFKDTIWILY